MKLHKINIKAISRSVILSMLLITIITIIGESSEGFKGILTKLTGHHWVSKGVISLIFFVLSSLLFSKLSKENPHPEKEIYRAIALSIALSLLLLLYFTWHYFSG